MNKKIKILELFGGIGAPRQALLNLGFEVKSDYVEIIDDVVNLYNHIYNENNKAIDITEFEPTDKDYDLLVAGFPCQPFSNAGKKLGSDDPRGKLYIDTLRVIKETKPKTIILENVKGILNYNHKWIIDDISNNLKEWGYQVITKTIKASDLGYLQARVRVFVIAIRDDVFKGGINTFNDRAFDNVVETFKPISMFDNDFKKQYEDINNFRNYPMVKTISANKVMEKTNYWILPRGSDGKLIDGQFNRVHKANQRVGTIVKTRPPVIGMVDTTTNELLYRVMNHVDVLNLMGFDGTEISKKAIESGITKRTIENAAGNSMVVGMIEVIIKFMSEYLSLSLSLD